MDYITLDPLFEFRPNDKITLIIGPSVSYLISNNLVRYVEEDGSERTSDAFNGEIPGVSDIDRIKYWNLIFYNRTFRHRSKYLYWNDGV